MEEVCTQDNYYGFGLHNWMYGGTHTDTGNNDTGYDEGRGQGGNVESMSSVLKQFSFRCF